MEIEIVDQIAKSASEVVNQYCKDVGNFYLRALNFYLWSLTFGLYLEQGFRRDGQQQTSNA